ncbi:hypothetical protein O4H49_14120 [Kiloniella laminariae]|uniref:Uncharacterized protein n=2 Tax=Kiloniella laminariae TaxID=454162 RepID=A0ABT4LLE1_9PROT|nr:hypothetical protein [Kiloniella laminariae]
MTRKSLSTLFFVTLAGGMFLSAPAIADCKKPSYTPPVCTKQYIEIQFSDSEDYDNCKREVNYYLENLDNWSKCIAEEVRLKGDEAIQRFQCKADGRVNCNVTRG